MARAPFAIASTMQEVARTTSMTTAVHPATPPAPASRGVKYTRSRMRPVKAPGCL